MNFSYPGRKNNDSVLEIFFLRSKHSERDTTSLARITSIFKLTKKQKKDICAVQRTETFSKLFGYCKCVDMTG